jgi:hypothetical protein
MRTRGLPPPFSTATSNRASLRDNPDTGRRQVSALDRLASIPEEEIWLQKQKSGRTRRAYRLDIQHFTRTLAITTPAELRQADHKAVIAWERHMREVERAAASTIRRRLAALSSLYKHLVRRGSARPSRQQQALYQQVTVAVCRTCHIAFDRASPVSGINWTTFAQYKAHQSTIKSYVCGVNKLMPHTLMAYRNFWLSAGPHMPDVLGSFTAAGWPSFRRLPIAVGEIIIPMNLPLALCHYQNLFH